jgi:hypothetical protein
MMTRISKITLLILLCACTARRHQAVIPGRISPTAPALPDTLLSAILKQHLGWFDTLMQQRDRWRIQIIYTQVDREAANRPRLTRHTWNLHPEEYFYPASTVKLPVAALALQHLGELKAPGLSAQSTLITEAAGIGQTAVYNDPTTPDGRPTIAQYIRKILLVSDNDAFNRLYEFLGQAYINRELHRMGYDSAEIIHRLNIFLPESANRATNPVRFYDTSGRLLLDLPPQTSRMAYQRRHNLLGNGFMRGDSLLRQPMDFSKKNRLPLSDLHQILVSLLMPDAVPEKARFHLSTEDRALLLHYGSRWPRESDFPSYDSSYNDTYSKLLFYGGKGAPRPGIRIFNKEGDAYGFLTDAAYIVDFDKGIEFFLSAVIYCNSDGVFNDDRYDYNNVGLPFLKHLGEAIYEYELSRPRARRPDLSGLPH